MLKYYISTIIIFIAFLCVSGLALAINLESEASVVAVGDNLIHPEVYNDAKTGKNSFDFKPMYELVKKDIKNADIAYVNQESPLGGDDRPYHGFKRFNTPSSVAQDLVDTGFNFVNGSNNHAMDQGESGINNSIHTWDKFKDKVLFTGVFNSQEARDEIPTKTVNGIKVSMLSYTFGTNGIKPSHPYTINTFDETQIKKDVKEAKKHSDAVIVSAHWGNEGHHMENKTQERYAKVFADAGVNVVLGMHPHVIEPVKWVKGKDGNKTLVAYSLGNFLNGQATGNESNDLLGCLNFKLVKNPKGVKVENVKWRSMVNHYELANVYDKNSKKDFKTYPLHDYNDKLAEKHGLHYVNGANMTKERLQEITKEVIDKEFLDDESL